MVQRKLVNATQAVVQRGCGVPVVIVGAAVLARLFAGRVQWVALAQPVILVVSSVHVRSGVAVVVGRKHQVKSLQQKVSFAVLHRGDERMAETVLLPEDGLLPNTGLDVLVHVRPNEAQHQAVGPRLVHKARLSDDGLVMIRVIEALHAYQLLLVEAARLEVQYGSVDVIIIVRVVLESVHLIGKTVFERLSEMDVRLVRVKRAIGVGRVDEPSATLLARNDIDDAADGIRPEAHRHHTFIYFNTLGKPTGMLFKPNELPVPSCGIPSMNTLTCLPLKPSIITCMSEPTPPDSRSFMPGTLASASLRFLVVFCNSLVSTATALKAERLTRLTPVDTTVTSSSCCTSGVMVRSTTS